MSHDIQPITPHLNKMSSGTLLHSPIEVMGAFLYMLRDYFSHGGLPWTWRSNPTETDVLIETHFKNLNTASDGRPAIYITRGQLSYNSPSIGTRDQYQPEILSKREEFFYAYGQCDINIDCLAKHPSVSERIGDIVQQFIMMSSNIIQGSFALHDISPTSLGTTVPFQKDEQLYTTPVMFRISFETRWKTVPAAASLNRLVATLEKTNTDISNYMQEMYLTATE